jgi:hypothetical protein
MEMAKTVMETDGDGSGDTSPSRQGAKTENTAPRNSSVAAAELPNSFWKITDCFRVFYPEALYRRRGIVRGLPGRPHKGWARLAAGPRPPIVWVASGPPPALIRSSVLLREK